MAVGSSSWTSSSDLDSPRSGASRSPGASPSSSGSPSIVAADTNDESHLGFLAQNYLYALGCHSPTSLQQSATLETTSRASGVRVTRCVIHTRCIATIYGVGIACRNAPCLDTTRIDVA